MNNAINIGTQDLKNLITNILGYDKVNPYMSIIDIFDTVGYKDYLEDVEEIVQKGDGVDGDPSTLVDELTVALKKNSINYIKQYGIIVDEEHAYNVGLSFYGDLMLALTSIPGMDISQAVYIDNVLNSDEIEDSSEKLFNILQVFNPMLDIHKYYYIVDKVYPQLLERIGNIVKNVLSNTDNTIDEYDINELLDTIIKIIDLFVKNEAKVVPSILINIMNNPTTLINTINSTEASKKFKILLNEYIKSSNGIDLNSPEIQEDTFLSLSDIASNIIVSMLLEGDDLRSIVVELGEYITNDITNPVLKQLYNKAINDNYEYLSKYKIDESIHKIIKEYKEKEGNKDG